MNEDKIVEKLDDIYNGIISGRYDKYKLWTQKNDISMSEILLEGAITSMALFGHFIIGGLMLYFAVKFLLWFDIVIPIGKLFGLGG